MYLRISLLLALTVAASYARTEQNITEQYDASPNGRLLVDVDFGSVEVTSGPDGKVSVEAHRKLDFRDESREKEYFADSPLMITKEGETVTIQARPRTTHHHVWRGEMTMDGRYIVRLPKQYNVDLHTSGGAIAVNGIKGEIKSNTSGGELKFTALNGPIDARTSGGHISMKECAGDTHISTSGGGIEIDNGSGTLDARTSGGSIAVRQFSGDTEVRTSGGKLTLENIKGKVFGRTSAGSIDVALADPVLADVNLDSSAGSIDLAVPPKAGLDVDARTSMGKIRSELPMVTTKSGDDRLMGTLNGGGKSVILRASVGGITIRPNSAPTASR
jgi:hypothetical protein